MTKYVYHLIMSEKTQACEDPNQSCNTTQLSRHASLFLANESYSLLPGIVLVPCNLSCRFCRI